MASKETGNQYVPPAAEHVSAMEHSKPTRAIALEYGKLAGAYPNGSIERELLIEAGKISRRISKLYGNQNK
jgi:hypothetical protein